MNDLIDAGMTCGIDGCSTDALTVGAPTDVTSTSSAHQLTIVSDVICPWCFVGKKNLEQALAIVGEDLSVDVMWLPYELNPSMPKEGMDRRDYRARKFGSWEYSQALDAQVAAAGAQAGITFHHERVERTPNTFDAHRLIWLAREEGLQDAVVEALFRAYFIDGRDVGRLDVLAEIAREANMSDAAVVGLLEGTAGAEAVRHEADSAKIVAGIGVPTFLLDGKVLFSGALKPQQMAARLRASVADHGED